MILKPLNNLQHVINIIEMRTEDFQLTAIEGVLKSQVKSFQGMCFLCIPDKRWRAGHSIGSGS